ncbi:NUDIX hydrolase [Leeia sp. TBRC 13508]|uniref:NUDIX hydrolase n=1 Tax=Leeia speluncae TaxID=2884804 RepID=A0ABS8D492_9NEIS|nr:NUDIX domain-containing protein [Leeia speluncae]MCB6182952.1 NUDIX hydrolase [Leeia speluncae]
MEAQTNQNYQSPIVTIDVVLLTLSDNGLQVALHQRKQSPYEHQLALPGGYIHTNEDESAEKAAFRVLNQKTGLIPRYLEQLKTYANTSRDPRGWSVSISHVALIPMSALKQAEKEVFQFFDVDNLPTMAFDHQLQIQDAVERVRNKSSYSTLPCWLLPELFTLTQLQQTYEKIFGESVSRGTFRSRLGIKVGDAIPGESADEAEILIATDQFKGGNQRPARLFKVNHLKLFKRACWS